MAQPVCPYCRMPFEQAGPAQVFCTACGTPHHEDCYQENGGCTVFGCARAPADDPKLQVSQSDLSAVNLPGQTYGQQSYMPSPAGATPYQSPTYGSPGGAAAPAAAPQAYSNPGLMYGRSQKSRSTFIVLGIFLGALGIHNFYAGYTGRAVGQLCLSVLTLGYLALVSWIWAIIEICLVTQDSSGLDFN
ncbi:MAG TPA: NINE protein [Candidatus Angelobacter sp.]|nr:NINE protein [Candidatus Angelobacter sp.]